VSCATQPFRAFIMLGIASESIRPPADPLAGSSLPLHPKLGKLRAARPVLMPAVDNPRALPIVRCFLEAAQKSGAGMFFFLRKEGKEFSGAKQRCARD